MGYLMLLLPKVVCKGERRTSEYRREIANEMARG